MIFKEYLKKIFKKFNLKIIKTNRRTPNTFTNDKPSLNLISSMIKCNGILHIGAHRGTESSVYNWLNKKVLWVEPNPKIFQDLLDNINNFYGQEAYNDLLGEKNLDEVDFFLSSNDYASSSVFDFSEKFKNKKNERNIHMIEKIKMKMITLDSMCEKNKLDLSNFDHWVIDTQGSELQILKGAKFNFKFCKSLYIEVSTDEIYADNSTKWNELLEFLKKSDFELIDKPTSEHCDVLFIRK